MKKSKNIVMSLLVFIFCSGVVSANNTAKIKTDIPELKGPYLGQKSPGIVPEVFAPITVSSKDNFEIGCTFSPDGKEFYFTRSHKGGSAIYVMKYINGTWTDPEVLNISKAQYYTEPHLNDKGDKLFFTEVNSSADKSQKPRVTISVVNRQKSGWSLPRALWIGMYATTAKNGNIYYTNNEKRAIYKRIYKNGYLNAEPVLIENVEFPTSHPYIAPDESFVIYGGFNPEGQAKGKWADLYVSFKKKDRSFGAAINLGDTVNNQYPNICPMITPDGKYLFYSNKGDIYWVSAKIIENLKPKIE